MYMENKSRFFFLIICGVRNYSKYQNNLKSILNPISLLCTLRRQTWGDLSCLKRSRTFFFWSLKKSLSSVYKFIASLSWNKLFLNSVAPFLGDCAFQNEPLTWACFSFEQNFLSNSSWEDGEADLLRFSRVAVKKRQPMLLKARFKVLYAAGHCKGNA